MANKLIKWVGDIAKKSLAFGDYIDVVQPSIYRGGLFNGQFFFGGNGIDYRFQYSNLGSCIKAYRSCPPLASIINRKAQCYINGITEINNTQGKKAGGEIAARLRKLLLRPNPLQTWKQFEAQQYIYTQLFGFCVTLPIIPAGMEELGPIYASSLWNIPSNLLEISESNRLFYESDISGMLNYIKLSYKGITTNLPIKNLFIFKDFIPSPDSMIFPGNRIEAQQMPINNITGSYMSRNELINYAGAQGIFSPAASDSAGAVNLKEEQKKALQEDFSRQYGIQRGMWRYIISPTAVNWTAVGKPTKDLMLFEEIIDDIMRLCDAYNYPSPLLNSEKGPSVSNTAVYQAQIYNDGIIPESQDLYEQWNAYLRLEQYNLVMVKSYNHVAVLQENKVESSAARKNLDDALSIEFEKGLITLNDWLIELGKDTLPGDLGNIRATDPKSSTVPLAVTIGVGGVQGLIEVLTASGLTDEAKASILEIVFGISSQDANRMAISEIAEPIVVDPNIDPSKNK